MNKKEAQQIINSEFHQTSGFNEKDPVLHRARGFLECLEQMQPVVEALQSIREGCSFPQNDVQKAIRDRSREALDHYRKNVLGEK
jgi:hypothetical protein